MYMKSAAHISYRVVYGLLVVCSNKQIDCGEVNALNSDTPLCSEASGCHLCPTRAPVHQVQSYSVRYNKIYSCKLTVSSAACAKFSMEFCIVFLFLFVQTHHEIQAIR